MEKNYRKGVIAIIIDNENNFLVVQLESYKHDEWNFVGGGREEDETLEETLFREIEEELGLLADNFEIIGTSSIPLKYDFPQSIIKEDGVVYHGQEKVQFILRLTGDKHKIKTDGIREYKWVTFKDLEQYLIFPYQYQNALKVINEIIPFVTKL